MILDDLICFYMIVDESIEGRGHPPRWVHSISNYKQEKAQGMPKVGGRPSSYKGAGAVPSARLD